MENRDLYATFVEAKNWRKKFDMILSNYIGNYKNYFEKENLQILIFGYLASKDTFAECKKRWYFYKINRAKRLLLYDILYPFCRIKKLL